jgi:hypothetical protein
VIDADARMRARLGSGSVEAAVGLVPPEWFIGADPAEVYADYLVRRLADGGFVEEAERARTGG